MADLGAREFYDSEYRSFQDAVSAAVRRAAFGEDIGQSSWLTAAEQRHFISLMALDADSVVLDVACGSGGPALFVAQEIGCEVTGIDLHPDGIAAAEASARERGLSERARFRVADIREGLPLADDTFDALQCIDAMNHVYQRARVLAEFRRVLRHGGRLLFTNPITVTGILRREEMLVRSGGMGEFVFTAPGIDEVLLEAAGLVDVRREDVTANMAAVSSRWRAARADHSRELSNLEGAETFSAIQEFLDVVATLATEGRLSRIVYVATKE